MTRSSYKAIRRTDGHWLAYDRHIRRVRLKQDEWLTRPEMHGVQFRTETSQSDKGCLCCHVTPLRFRSLPRPYM